MNATKLPKRIRLKMEFSAQAPASVCICGHSGDGHGSDHRGGIGHGYCSRVGCCCQKFSWQGWTRQYRDFCAKNGLKVR